MKMNCFNCDFDLFDRDFTNWFEHNQQPTPGEVAQNHANEFGHTVQYVHIVTPEAP